MRLEDTNERLARIEGVLAGVQSEIMTMREALMRLVRIEEQHAATRDEVRRVHERLDTIENHVIDHDRQISGIKGPLVWAAGIASSAIAATVSFVLNHMG